MSNLAPSRRKATRRRLTQAEREEMQRDALGRAVSFQSTMNYGPIIAGFVAKGVPADDISPRENVFTYNAWRALGRQVRKGEHGVKVTTMKTIGGEFSESVKIGDDGKPDPRTGKRIFVTATVFHISQTDPVNPTTDARA